MSGPPVAAGRHPELERLEALAEGGLGPVEVEELRSHAASCALCAGELSALRAERALFAARASRPRCGQERLWTAVAARIALAPSGSISQGAAPSPARGPAAGLRGRRPPVLRRVLGAAAGLAAAAAVLLVVGGGRLLQVLHAPTGGRAGTAPSAPATGTAGGAGGEPGDAADAAAASRVNDALDRADADYARALAVLEAEVAARRPALEADAPRGLGDALRTARAGLDRARVQAEGDVDARLRVLGGYARYLRSLRQVVQDSEEATP